MPPTRSRPASFGNLASEITATLVTAPAESVTDTVPFWAIVTDCDPAGIVILVSLAAPVSGLPFDVELEADDVVAVVRDQVAVGVAW